MTVLSIAAARGISILALAVLVVAGCGHLASNAPRSTVPTFTESLVFTGAVSGTLRVAINPQPTASTNPRNEGGPPRSTRCATFFSTEPSGNRDQLYEADIVGMVAGVRYGFYVQVAELALTPVPGAFTLSLGAYSRGDAALLSSDGVAATQWYRTAGMAFPSGFTVSSDLTSGTVDAGLAAGPHGSVVHITGSWRCA
jgi:hypothetical protein